MLLIPAIDLKNNNCVRLLKGDFNNIILFSNNPVKIIEKWSNFCSERIHIIDLDGALYGKPKNLFIIKSLIKFNNSLCKLQLGGGIRSYNVINFYFNIGINYIILGTKVLLDLKFFKIICYKFKNKLILSLDLKNNKIFINGWNEEYNFNLLKFLLKIKNFIFESIICTDINKDGTLNGLNINLIFNLSLLINKPIIASGGLFSLLDIKNIFNFQKYLILGIICGKSIYLGYLNYFNIQIKINNLNKIYIK